LSAGSIAATPKAVCPLWRPSGTTCRGSFHPPSRRARQGCKVISARNRRYIKAGGRLERGSNRPFVYSVVRRRSWREWRPRRWPERAAIWRHKRWPNQLRRQQQYTQRAGRSCLSRLIRGRRRGRSRRTARGKWICLVRRAQRNNPKGIHRKRTTADVERIDYSGLNFDRSPSRFRRHALSVRRVDP
jgi:hypothetical protein